MADSDDRARLAAAGLDPTLAPGDPLFPSDGWLRRISQESVLLFGGGRALLLEIAHPLVAAGVAEHSDFRRDPFGRLQRTLDALSELVFGDVRTALAAARRVERTHERIRGALGETLGPFTEGHAYDGRDPALVWWVWATLVDTSLVVYDRFVEPLDDAARDAFYADHRKVALLLGARDADLAPSHAEFQRAVEAQVASPELTVGAEAREIARHVLHPPGVTGAGTLRLVTTALLPPALREPFGLPWDAARQDRFDALVANVRRLREGGPAAARRRSDLR